jgi:hypothetical protein
MGAKVLRHASASLCEYLLASSSINGKNKWFDRTHQRPLEIEDVQVLQHAVMHLLVLEHGTVVIAAEDRGITLSRQVAKQVKSLEALVVDEPRA